MRAFSLALLSAAVAIPTSTGEESGSFKLFAFHPLSPIHLNAIQLTKSGHLSAFGGTSTNFTTRNSLLYANEEPIGFLDNFAVANANDIEGSWVEEEFSLKYNGTSSFFICSDTGNLVFSTAGEAPSTCQEPVDIELLVYDFFNY